VLQVLVVDNDADGGARTLCEQIAGAGAIKLRYFLEPQRGLSVVRNRLLEEALHTGAEFFAFLDDDELPDPDWLARHLGALAATGADVSCGPVIQLSRESAGAPAPSTSQSVPPTPRYVACNNVVFRRRLAAAQGLRFDMRFNFTGGEDFDFFEASRRQGNRHIWAGAARVYETLRPDRATPGYLFYRHFTGAVTRVLQERKWRPGPGVWLRFLVKSCGKVLGGSMCLARALLPPHRPDLCEAIKRYASACGYLCGLLHVRAERYR